MPKTIKDLRNVTGLIICDGLDTVMKTVNQQARQIQSAIIEGQSAGAGATLAFGEDAKTKKLTIDLDEAAVKDAVHSDSTVKRYLEGSTVVKEIYVKNKIYNIVVKPAK